MVRCICRQYNSIHAIALHTNNNNYNSYLTLYAILCCAIKFCKSCCNKYSTEYSIILLRATLLQKVAQNVVGNEEFTTRLTSRMQLKHELKIRSYLSCMQHFKRINSWLPKNFKLYVATQFHDVKQYYTRCNMLQQP